jgi:hypothetical protein
MSDNNDDDDEDVRKVRRLSDDPRWQAKQTAPSSSFDISSKEEAIEWASKFFAQTSLNGVPTFIDEMLWPEVNFINRKNFVERLEDKRLLITDANDPTKSKYESISDLWLKSPLRQRKVIVI